MAFNLPSVYVPGGLDLSMPATMREMQKAADGLNFTFTPANSLVKRRGFVKKAGNVNNNSNGWGLAIYESREPISITVPGFGLLEFGVEPFGSPTQLGFGDVNQRLVSMGPIPYIWETTVLDVTCASGHEDWVTISTQSDGAVHFEILDSGDGTTEHLDVDLGDGMDSGDVTLASLQSTVDGETNYSATLSNTGGANARAAGLNRAYRSTLNDTTAQSFVGGYWKTMNPVLDTPWQNIATHYGDEDYENATAVTMNGSLYMSNGWDPMLKYDGQRCYYAGMPLAATPSAASTSTAATSGLDGAYKYAYQYVYVDSLGNEILGEISDFSSTVTNNEGPGDPKQIQVRVGNLDTTTGYNTSHALVDGTQTAADQGSGIHRIQVQNDPSLVVGDTIFFLNRSTDEYETREITAVTDATTHWNIDVRTDSQIDLNDGDILSANLRIRLYRTKAGGTALYYLVDVPNNPTTTLQDYTDNTPDNQLLTLFSAPENSIALPPKCRYSVIWQNNIVLAGDPLDPFAVYYSEYDGTSLVPENFPGVNTFVISADKVGGKITGLAVLEDTLLVFTDSSIFTVSGNLVTNSLSINLLSDSVGCVAHHTIASIDRNLLFLSKKGVYRITPGAQRSFVLSLISQDLNPIFRKGSSVDYEIHEKQSVGIAWPNEQVYALFLPITAETGSDNYATTDSRTFVYHLETGAWSKWDNVNMAGGAVIFTEKGYPNNAPDLVTKESLWIQDRAYLSAGNITTSLYRMSDTETEIDFSDHDQAINFEYRPQWEFANSPTGLKMYNEIALDAFRTSSQLAYTPTGTITAQIFRDFDGSTVENTFTFDYLSNDRRIIRGLPLSHRRAIGINFKNNEFNKQVLISGWNWEYLRYRPEIRR